MDPFAVLGLAPTANDYEIRDAYLRRSKQLHPDRFADATPEEQEAATRAMQDVNAAYFALRSGTYVPPATTPPTTPPTPSGPSPSTPGAPYAAPPRRPPPTKRRRVSWLVIVLAGLAAAAGLALLTGGGGGPHSITPSSPDQTIDLRRLQGDCLTYNDDGQLNDIIDCTRPHAARVMKVVDHGTPCPVWTDSSIPGRTKDLCLDTHQ